MKGREGLHFAGAIPLKEAQALLPTVAEVNSLAEAAAAGAASYLVLARGALESLVTLLRERTGLTYRIELVEAASGI